MSIFWCLTQRGFRIGRCGGAGGHWPRMGARLVMATWRLVWPAGQLSLVFLSVEELG